MPALSKPFLPISYGVVVAVVLAGCVQVPTAPIAPVQPPSMIEVKLIAFNDFHGNLKAPSLRVPVVDATQVTGLRFDAAGGVEQFAAVVKSLRAKNPHHAVISAGDMVGATPLLSAFFRDEPTIEAMNLVGVDFHSAGNHEFDYGVTHLKRLQAGGCAIDAKTNLPDCQGRAPYQGAKFQFLAANVLEDATNKTLFSAYGVKEFDGIKMAFIGMTLRGTPSIVRPGGTAGLTFADEVETVNKLVPTLQAQGIEAIVVVMHEGGEQTGGINECVDFKGRGREIAEKLHPAIQVVVTAHTHRYYICDVAGKLVTSAGSYGTLVTEIDLTLDRTTRKIVNKSAKNLIVKPDGPKDPLLTSLVDQYAKLSEPLENRIVARLRQEISGVTNPAGESTLGNLIADAHLFGTASPDKGGAVIAFNNPGSLRAPIIPNADGGVTYGALFKAQPFQNDLIVMNLTGAQIKQLLEQQFGATIGERVRIMGVSAGFSFTWDATKPRGERVIAESMKLNGTTMRPNLQYRVTANSFVAGGGEELTAFREGTERQVSVLDLEALVSFLIAASANAPYVVPPTGLRISRLN